VLARQPLDLTDPADRVRLRASADGDPAATARLDTEADLAADLAPALLPGDPVRRLAEAVDLVPGDTLPVVTTTWVLSALGAARRQAFVAALARIAVQRPVAWASVEGVGVAPGVPTLGDRPASGHSLLGLAVLDPGTAAVGSPADVLGRCWSRGRVLSWLGP